MAHIQNMLISFVVIILMDIIAEIWENSMLKRFMKHAAMYLIDILIQANLIAMIGLELYAVDLE